MSDVNVALVITAPALADVGGVRLYSAEADVGAPAKRMRLIILPACDGDFAEVAIGDRVLVGITAGVAYYDRHFVPHTGDAGSGRVIQPPRSGGDVKIGARSGGDWEPFMLYANMHASYLQSVARENMLALQVASLMDSRLAGTGAAWLANALTGWASVPSGLGGAASSGAKGRAIAEAVES